LVLELGLGLGQGQGRVQVMGQETAPKKVRQWRLAKLNVNLNHEGCHSFLQNL
jgi:hypothetical protein